MRRLISQDRLNLGWGGMVVRDSFINFANELRISIGIFRWLLMASWSSTIKKISDRLVFPRVFT